MKITHRSPARAAWAETELARLPVEAQETTWKPRSIAHAIATGTTRSLYEQVGWLTESSLIHSSPTPSFLASRSARTSGVKPEDGPIFPGSATGRTSW